MNKFRKKVQELIENGVGYFDGLGMPINTNK
jgi:hypothetical protein